MDPDYHQVPVGAASEGGRVLQTVSQSGLQLPPAGHPTRRGDGHEAVGIQREACNVHVPGQCASLGGFTYMQLIILHFPVSVQRNYHAGY